MPTGPFETIIAWKSEGLSDEIIRPPTTPGNILVSNLKWILNLKIALGFKRKLFEIKQSNFYL